MTINVNAIRVAGCLGGGGTPSDLTDEQWALVEPLLPAPRPDES